MADSITPAQARAELERRRLSLSRQSGEPQVAAGAAARDHGQPEAPQAVAISREQARAELQRRKALSQSTEPSESDASAALRAELSGMTQNPSKALFDQLPKWQKPIVAAQDIFNVGLNGASLGFADKGAAAVRSAVTGNPYEDELQGMRARTEASRNRAGGAGTVAEIGGAIALPSALASQGVTLAGRLGTHAMSGAKGIATRSGLMGVEGAGYGAATALGNDTAIDAGAVVGGVGGAAVPIIAGVARAAAKPITDAIKARRNPAEYAATKVAERLGNSMTPDQAAQRMARNPGTNLADVGGKSVRDLLRTTANIPGPAKDRLSAQLTVRQFGQGDRLRAAISRTFADPDGYLAAKDEIADEASRLAAPLYKEAYKQPVHFSETLENILVTPAGQRALRKAEELAANEQVPFQQLFASVSDDGASAKVRRVPDTRGWDYIKRAMDDMIDGQTDSITKKVTNEGRILTTLKNKMLQEVDQFNPAYKTARQTFSGQAQLDKALELGRGFPNMSPPALKRAFAGMNEAEKASARIGAADALRKQISDTGVTQNAVLRLFSKRGQIENLKELFESSEKFAEFRKSIFSEARKRATYDAVKGNSSTASQLADMAEAGGLRDTVDLARTTVTQGPVTATMQWVGSRLKMLGGLTPEVADNVARQLTASGPQAVGSVMTELSRIGKMQASEAQRRQAVDAFLVRTLGITGGLTATPVPAAATEPPRVVGQDRREPTVIDVPVPIR